MPPPSSSGGAWEAFITKPHMQKLTTSEEPPEEKNGRGIPVVGAAPHTTAQFKSDCMNTMHTHPKDA